MFCTAISSDVQNGMNYIVKTCDSLFNFKESNKVSLLRIFGGFLFEDGLCDPNQFCLL